MLLKIILSGLMKKRKKEFESEIIANQSYGDFGLDFKMDKLQRMKMVVFLSYLFKNRFF